MYITCVLAYEHHDINVKISLSCVPKFGSLTSACDFVFVICDNDDKLVIIMNVKVIVPQLLKLFKCYVFTAIKNIVYEVENGNDFKPLSSDYIPSDVSSAVGKIIINMIRT